MAFPNSIRWRLQLWLAFLLLCVLTGFGVTALQLHRITRFAQIDADLQRRVDALKESLHQPPPFDDRRGPPPFLEGRGRLPRRGRPNFPQRRGRPELPIELRNVQLSPNALALFYGSNNQSFYFAIWTRDGELAKQSTNALPNLSFPVLFPAGFTVPDNETLIQMRGSSREAIYFTEPGDVLLVGLDITPDLEGIRGFTAWLINRDHGKIRVVTSQGEDSGCISISDTGPGIEAEDLPHIFERFYRADKSRARSSGRSGLGLAICRSIISVHGGFIEVTSTPGTGTTFSVQLPNAPKRESVPRLVPSRSDPD